MLRLVRTLHIYTGLFCFTALIVYGISGLYATFRPAPGAEIDEPWSVRYVAFDVPGNLTDRELADRVHETLALPLTSRPPNRLIARGAQDDLVIDYYTVGGRHRVTVLEREGRIRVEAQRTTLGSYLNQLHMARGSPPPRLLRAWVWYNWLATFALIGMAASGMLLWLATRPRHVTARVSFVAGSLVAASFIVLLW